LWVAIFLFFLFLPQGIKFSVFGYVNIAKKKQGVNAAAGIRQRKNAIIGKNLQKPAK
jgi:hypothetical protein